MIMKKEVKRGIALLLGSSMVFALAGCGTSGNVSSSQSTETTGGAVSADSEESVAASTAESTGTADSGEKIPIVISCYLADDNQVAVRQKYFDEPLAEAFPDCDIEVKMYTDRQSLQIEVAGGGGPDILDLDGPTDVAEFAKADRVLPLDDYAAKYGWKDMFYDWAYNSCFYNDKLYSLPNSFEGMVIYYNMDVMNENGWEKPKSKDELETLAQKAMDAGYIPFSFGNSDYQGAVDWLYSTFTSCYGGGVKSLKNALAGDGHYTDDGIKESFEIMNDWWQKGWIGNKASQSITTTDLVAFFAEGRAAMMINGTWASSGLLATYPDCNWDSEMLPDDGVNGQVLPFATGGGYAINANSEHADKAAEILNWIFTSMDRHYASINEAGYQPYPLKNFDMAKLEGMDKKLYDQYKLLMDAQANNQIGYCSWTFYPSDMRVYMNENVDGIFLQTLTIDDFLKESDTYLQKAKEEGTVPTLP